MKCTKFLEIQTDHLVPARRPVLEKNLSTSRFSGYKRVIFKENEKDKYQDIARGLKKWLLNIKITV